MAQQQQQQQSPPPNLPPPRLGVKVAEKQVRLLGAERVAQYVPKPRKQARDDKKSDARAEKQARRALACERREAEEKVKKESPTAPLASHLRELPPGEWIAVGYSPEASARDGATEAVQLHLRRDRLQGRGLVGNALLPLPVGPRDVARLMETCRGDDAADLATAWFAPVLVHRPLLYVLLAEPRGRRGQAQAVDAVVPASQVYFYYRTAMRFLAALYLAAEKEKPAPESELTEEQLALQEAVERNYEARRSAFRSASEAFDAKLQVVGRHAQDSLALLCKDVLGQARGAFGEGQPAAPAARWAEADGDAEAALRRRHALQAAHYVAWRHTVSLLNVMELSLCEMLSVDPRLVPALVTPSRVPPADEASPQVRRRTREHARDSLRAYAHVLLEGARRVRDKAKEDAEGRKPLPDEDMPEEREGRWILARLEALCGTDEALHALPAAADGVSPLDWYLVRLAAWSRLRDALLAQE